MAEKKTIFPTRPSLVGEKLFLRPATPDDVVNMEYWATISQPESMGCRLRRFYTPSEVAERYKGREKSIWEQRFAVVRKDDKMLVGAVNFFGYNPLNRSAELGLIIDPDERKKGYGKEALRILTRYLFRYRGLNKVQAQTAEFNEAAVKLLESLGFKKDGTLRDHYFYKGEFHNGFVYSLLLYELDW